MLLYHEYVLCMNYEYDSTCSKCIIAVNQLYL